MKRVRMGVLAFLGVAVVPAAALAQETREAGIDRDLRVQAGVGVTTYAGEAAQFTAPGVTYGVQVGFDLGWVLDAELAYEGAAYGTDSNFGEDQNSIVENGGHALLMIAPEVGAVRPYGFGGLSMTRLTVLDDGASTAPVQSATLVQVPFGVGVDVFLTDRGQGRTDLVLGARAGYEATLDSGAFPTLGGSESGSNQVHGMLTFGGSF